MTKLSGLRLTGFRYNYNMKIELTKAQLRCLIYAAGDIMDHDDIVEQEYPHKTERECAYRAYEKLKGALRSTRANR